MNAFFNEIIQDSNRIESNINASRTHIFIYNLS